MKKKCLFCGVEYNPQDSDSFFNFKYCNDECEQKAEIEARSASTGVHMYMCISPMQINIWQGKNGEQKSVVEEGTKWQRDDSKLQGLSMVHLVNTSGRLDEVLGWLEISEQALKEHFQKI